MTLQQEAEQKAGEIDRLNVAYSSEVEQLKLEVRDLNSHNELLIARYKAEVTEYKAKIEVLDSKCENTEKLLQQERGLSEESLQKKDAIIAGMKRAAH